LDIVNLKKIRSLSEEVFLSRSMSFQNVLTSYYGRGKRSFVEENKSFYIFLKSPSSQSFIKSLSLSELESSLSLKKKEVFLSFWSPLQASLSSSHQVFRWRKKKSFYVFEVPFKPVFHQVIKSFWTGIKSFVEEKRSLSNYLKFPSNKSFIKSSSLS